MSMIVLEGLDASGKATQSKMLKERLERDGRQVVLYSFPRYETVVGQAILRHLKGYLSMRENHYIDSSDMRIDGDLVHRLAPEDALAFQCLMLADKVDASRQIANDIYEGRFVICDRWWQSAVAFGAADGLDWKWLNEIHYFMPKADANIFIKVSPEEALKRRPQMRDRYEKDRAKQEVVRSNYQRLWEEGREGFFTVDGSVTIDEVHSQIWDIVMKGQGQRDFMSTYVFGAGKYMFMPGRGLLDETDDESRIGRRFQLRGRGGSYAQAHYYGDDKNPTAESLGVSWIGERLSSGHLVPVDGTPAFKS